MDKTTKDKLDFFNYIAELLGKANDAESISSALYKIIEGFIKPQQEPGLGIEQKGDLYRRLKEIFD